MRGEERRREMGIKLTPFNFIAKKSPSEVGDELVYIVLDI